MPAGARGAAGTGAAGGTAAAAPAAGRPAPQAQPPRWTGPRRAIRHWRCWLPGTACVLVPGLTTLLVTGYGLGRVSLWRDEAYTIEAARRTAGQIFLLLHHTDAVNSAYYLFLHPFLAAGGDSAAAARLPSVLAMAVTAAVTAAIGRRLARLAALPSPALTGGIAGLFVAAAPMVTRYAQEARSYALVTMLASVASYLLVRALTDPRWRWWAGYGLAVALAGLFNLLALLLVVAHGLTLLIIRTRRGVTAPAGLPAVALRPLRWLAAVTAAGVMLSPLVLLGYLQRGQISWLSTPGMRDALDLAASFAGSKLLELPAGLLALAGIVAGLAGRPRVPVPPAAVALPWLAAPPLILLAVSQISPVYDARYVVYCLPALALLCAAGLSWLARVTAQTPLGATRGAAWLPSVAIGVVLAAALVPPQEHVRAPWARPDNLRKFSAIVAAHERPGDAVIYLPQKVRVMGMGYPAPFRKLLDIGLAKSPAAAGNLIGTSVGPQVLPQRLAGVSRIWLITMQRRHHPPPARTRLEKAEVALLRHWHLAGRWHSRQLVLSLYQR